MEKIDIDLNSLFNLSYNFENLKLLLTKISKNVTNIVIILCDILLFLLFTSVAQLYLTLCDPMNCSMPGLSVHHQLPEFTQTHVHPAISSSVVPLSSCSQ